jgi:Nuclease A inhibitor-like protein
MDTKDRPSAPQLLQALDEAAAGLVYTSESDAPITSWEWPAPGVDPSAAGLVTTLGLPADTRVETLSADDLLGPFARPEQITSAEDDAEAKRFQALLDLVKRELSHVVVYRVGRIDIDVYLVGRHASGAWLGLTTHVVET